MRASTAIRATWPSSAIRSRIPWPSGLRSVGTKPDTYLTKDDGLPKRPKEKRWRDTIKGFRAKGGEQGNYSGWRVGDVLGVIDAVLKRERPEAAIIMIGTNDISGGSVPADYRAGLKKIVQKCLDAHCVPILNTIPPRVGHDAAVEAANRIVRDVARECQVPLADFHAECLRLRPGQSWQKTIISDDGVHPSGGKNQRLQRREHEGLRLCLAQLGQFPRGAGGLFPRARAAKESAK